ncbi:hypothetical protein AVEN_45145-1 [Araneus ventricosus]|uniref:RNase H type-1 domain-containing protein n=1 Tax=Araneus ventricosus TaxID=182803 RepID=A0A4Y2GQJ1_ARAVE|nr:hypothetical protein AVEN_45145-1 [Araneus ventricosus]
MKNWGVLDIESHSDHKYIYLKLKIEDLPEADFFLKSKYGQGHTNSVFQAELAAIQYAANWAVSENSNINIYTDSLSSILALQSASSRSNFVNKAKSDLYGAKNMVSLSWVRAHVGIQGNELAHQQAKLSISIGEELRIPAPRSFLNR